MGCLRVKRHEVPSVCIISISSLVVQNCSASIRLTVVRSLRLRYLIVRFWLHSVDQIDELGGLKELVENTRVPDLEGLNA
jgi:hypothetical protein